MRAEHEPCAMCARFTTRGYDEQAAQGIGYCSGYEEFRRGDAHPTPLFIQAPQREMAARRAFLEKHKQADSNVTA